MVSDKIAEYAKKMREKKLAEVGEGNCGRPNWAGKSTHLRSIPPPLQYTHRSEAQDPCCRAFFFRAVGYRSRHITRIPRLFVKGFISFWQKKKWACHVVCPERFDVGRLLSVHKLLCPK